MDNTQLLEAQILHTIITTPEWVDSLANSGDDFYHYKDVYKAILKLKDEGKVIDYASVLAFGKQAKEMCLLVLSDENWGMAVIPSKKIFEERIELLHDLSTKVQLAETFAKEFDLEALKSKLETIYKKGSSRWLTGEDIKTLALEIMRDKKENTVTYGLNLLDKSTKGIGKGQYIIVAGRPSVGKSAFLQYVGLRNAERGKKVLFVSAEMSEEMVIGRILSTYQPEGIPTNFNILIASDTGTIEAEIQKKARDFDLILVDYIQLLKAKTKSKDLYERVTNISGELKTMATKFNLPFMCASQFSRKAEGNQPNLSDLKESGALEQDADVVVSLWKNKGDDSLILNELIVPIRIDLLKNRNGWTFANTDTKVWSVMFKKDEFRFFDTERSEKP